MQNYTRSQVYRTLIREWYGKFLKVPRDKFTEGGLFVLELIKDTFKQGSMLSDKVFLHIYSIHAVFSQEVFVKGHWLLRYVLMFL